MIVSENGEPLTPKEETEARAEIAVRDAWLAVTEASRMFNDPTSRPFIQRQRDDILSMRTKLDFLASAIVESDRG
jgi:hypothetical protein